jgi:hypothetical protein
MRILTASPTVPAACDRSVRSIWLCLAMFATLSLSACHMHNQTAFDSNTWKSQRGQPARQNQRGEMVGILQQTLQAGMRREEVIRLLGEPDRSDEGIDIYELGVSPFGIDEEYYEIKYQDGAVVSHRWGRR